MRETPVAWFVKDFADGWIHFENEEDARREAEETGAILLAAYERENKPPRVVQVSPQSPALPSNIERNDNGR